MNDTLYLKKSLISRIETSTDVNFLKALQTIFDSSEKELYKLNDAQTQSIEAGRKDIESGKCKPHKQVMDEMKVWLKNQ